MEAGAPIPLVPEPGVPTRGEELLVDENEWARGQEFFRLADLYATRKRADEAIQVMEALLAATPADQAERVQSYLNQLRSMRNPPPAEPAAETPTTDP